MENRIFCPFCGEEVSKDKQGNLFCCFCNKTFAVTERLTQTEQQDENKAEEEKPQEEKPSNPENTENEDNTGSNAKTLGCLAFLVLVVIAVIAIVVAVKEGGGNQSPSQNTTKNSSSYNYSSDSNFLTGRTDLTPGNIRQYCSINSGIEGVDYDMNWATVGRRQVEYTIVISGYSSLYSYHNVSVTVEMEFSYSVTEGNLFKSTTTHKTRKASKTIDLTVGGDGSARGVIDLGGLCDSDITGGYTITSVTGYVKKQ